MRYSPVQADQKKPNWAASRSKEAQLGGNPPNLATLSLMRAGEYAHAIAQCLGDLKK